MSPSTHTHTHIRKDSAWKYLGFENGHKFGAMYRAINWKCRPRCFSTRREEVLSIHITLRGTARVNASPRGNVSSRDGYRHRSIGRRFSPPLNANSTIRKGNFLPSRFRVLCCVRKKKGFCNLCVFTGPYLRDTDPYYVSMVISNIFFILF